MEVVFTFTPQFTFNNSSPIDLSAIKNKKIKKLILKKLRQEKYGVEFIGGYLYDFNAIKYKYDDISNTIYVLASPTAGFYREKRGKTLKGVVKKNIKGKSKVIVEDDNNTYQLRLNLKDVITKKEWENRKK